MSKKQEIEFKIELKEIDGQLIPVKVYPPKSGTLYKKEWTVKSKNYLVNGNMK